MDRENKVQQYVAQLVANPYDLAPLGQLEQSFSAQERWEELVALFEQRAPEVTSRDAAARLYLEAARMAGTRLNDLERSLELLSRSLAVGEDTLVSVEAYLFQLALHQDGEQLLSFFSEAVNHGDDGAYKSRLYHRMGSILEDVLGDTEEADNAYKWALDLDPANVGALWARQVLARKQQAWTRLAELLVVEIEVCPEPARQAELSVTLGELYRDYLDAAESAAQCFAYALELEPGYPRAVQALAAMGYDVGAPADAEVEASDDRPMTVELDEAMLLDDEFGAVAPPPMPEVTGFAVDDDEEEELVIDGGQVLSESAAVEASVADDEVMDSDAEEAGDLDIEADAGAFSDDELELAVVDEADADYVIESAGEEVGDDEPGSDEPALEAADAAEASEQLADSADAVALLDESEGVAVTEDDEVLESVAVEEDGDEVLESVAVEEDGDEAVEQLGDLDESLEDEVVAEPEADDDEEDGEQTAGWRARVAALRERAAAAGGEEQLRLLVRAARLESRHRETLDDGLQLWRDALGFGVGQTFYRRTSYLSDDAEFWRGVLSLVDDLGAEQASQIKARIALYNLNDTEQARQFAEAAGDDEIVGVLEDLGEANDNWRKYQRTLEQRYAEVEGDEKARRVYLRMADVGAALGDIDKEIDALRRLERQTDDDQVRNRLKMLYKRSEKWPMYVDLVKQEVEALSEERVEDKIDLLYEVIRVYRQEMNHDRMAINVYKDVLALNPEDLDAIDQLIELYGEMNMSSDLINMLQTKATLVRGKAARVAIYSQIAELFLEKFRNQAEAIKAYESVLEIEPYHAQAIAFLKEMYEKRRDWEKLIDVHKREIETFDSQAQKAAGYKEVAQLATDKLRKPEVATELWLEARQFAPDDPEILDALEALYEKNRDFEALADVLEQKVSHAAGVDEKMKLFSKLGMLYSDRLGDSERAIGAWRGALEIAPEDLKARKSLERLFIDNRDWQALEDFYAESDAYPELVRLLETLVSTMKEDALKIELLLRAARVWRTQLDDTGRAERNLDRVLQLDASNEGAAIQLEPIYRDAQDFGRLTGVLEVILSHRSTPEERREYQLKLAQLHEQHLGDWAGAFEWYAQAFREAPVDSGVETPLENAAREANAWNALVGIYSEALEGELELDAEQALRLRLGRVLDEELNRLDDALAQFEAVLESEPDNLKALASMESIFWQSERWDDLMKVYRHRLDLEQDSQARVQILQGMARIAEDQAGDISTAIERYGEALELDARNEETLRQLHRLYALQDQHTELAEIIRQEIDLVERRARLASRRPVVSASVALEALVPDAATGEASDVIGGDVDDLSESSADLSESSADLSESSADLSESSADLSESSADLSEAEDELEAGEAASAVEAIQGDDLESVDLSAHPFYTEDEIEWLTELRYELGVICMQHLGAYDEAIVSLGLVLAWRPVHADACAALESFLDVDEYSLRVARILEPYYEVHGQWHEFVHTLSIQLDHVEDDADAIALLERIGFRYLTELGDGASAFESYGRMLRMVPSSPTAQAQLRRIAHALDMWIELVTLYEEILPGIGGDEELHVNYLFTLANMYAHRLDEAARAREYFEKILAVRPTSMRALDDLEELFIATEAWRDLLGVYDRKLELTEEAPEREALKVRKAVLWEELLGNPHEAISIYNEILEATPDNLPAVRSLSRIFANEQMWADLSENLVRELELVDDEEHNSVKNRLAAVFQLHLGEPGRAVDLYEEVIERDAGDADAIAALEVLMHQETAPQHRIACILEPLYVDSDDWARLIEALEVQVATTVEAAERVELLHRIARLHEARAGSAQDAFATYARALRDDVANERTLENLYRITDLTSSHEELVATFEDEAAFQIEPDVKRDMLRRAAALYIEPLDALESATARLHEVLELFPADLETVEELETIYRHTQQWPELVSMLVRKSELVEQEADKKDLLYQAGTIHEDVLDAPVDAIEVYNRVLAIDENDAHAIDRLEVLYTRLERWHDLLEVYDTKLELAGDDEARKDLLYVMGAIHQEHLLESQDAIDTYRRILDIDPRELAALERLDGLYEQTEQWHELLETLEQELDLTQLETDAQTLKYRIGRLWEVHLGDALRGIDVYREVLLENPTHGPTTEALEGLIERGEFEVEAAEVLQPIYQDEGQWEKLVHVHRLLIQATSDTERKLALFVEIGQIFETRLMDGASAFGAYVEALAVDAGRTEILDTLERLAAELDGWDVLIDQLDERLHEESDFEVVTALNLRIARIFEEELHDASSAIVRFQRVLEIEPTEATAILALDRLFQQEGRWAELAEILRTRIDNTNEPEVTLELRLRLGMLYQSALEDEAAAIDTYQAVLLDDPDNRDAIGALEQMFMAGQSVGRIADILEPYYLDKGQHEKLVEIYLQRLELLTDPQERYDVLMQVARIFLNELQDASRAMQAYGAALVQKPDDEQAIAEIERLAAMTVEWSYAAAYFADAIESPNVTDEAALNLWLRLARILDEELEQYEEAEMAYLRALSLEAGEPKALESLDRIYLMHQRWEELAEILARRIEGTFDEIEVVDLSYRLAQCYQHQLGEYARAVETYERILSIQPDHEDSLRMLEQIHTEQQVWPDLFDVLERRSELTHDPDEQAGFFARMANLAEEMLDRRQDAIDLWTRVADVRPDDLDALRELHRLYLGEQRWVDLVSIIEREVELTHDPNEQLELYVQLGTIWGEYLGNEGQALEAWQNVLRLNPEHLPALEALRDLCTRAGDYAELAGILERLIAHYGVEDDRKLELWIELGEVQGDMLMQPEHAIHAWQNVLGLDPANDLALDNLERLFIQESRWEESAQVLEIKADRTDDVEQRIELLLRVADTWESKLLERERAAQYYEQVLQYDMSNVQASQALEAIYVEQGSAEAFHSLANLYIQRSQIVEDAFERLETLRGAARVFEEHLQEAESALVVLISAFAVETSEDAELIADLERLARQTGLWEELVGHVSDVLNHLGDTYEAAALHRLVGQWRAQELGQLDDAVYHLQMALRIDADNVEVIDLLEGLYRELAMWPELANTLHTRVELAREPEERVEIWRKLGELYELQMGQIDEAIDAYRNILAIDDSDLLAMESLERAYEAFDRWIDLIEILTTKATATYDPEQIVEIKSRIGQIWEERLFDIDRAILAYQEVLSVDQAHEPSLYALERLYMQVERWTDVVDVYEQRLALTHEPEVQVDLYGRLAAVFEEQFQDYDRAVEAYNNVLAIQVDNQTAIQNLERLYRGLERWFELVDVVQRHIDIADYADQRVELYRELGRVQRDHIGDQHAAIEAFVKSLDLEPVQAELWHELAVLYENTANWESAIECYRRLVDLVDRDDEQVAIYHRMGHIFESELHSDSDAEDVYQAALRIAPTHPEVLEALSGVCERQQDWHGLIRVLKAAESASRELSDKARFLARVGRIYETRLDDLVSALRYYETALESDPQMTEAAAPLIDMYINEKKWERAVPLLEIVVEELREAESDGDEHHHRQLQLAMAYENLAQHEQALQEYRNAYELNPTDVMTLRGLGRLLYDNQEFEAASKVLQALQVHHADSIETDELVEVYYRLGAIRHKLGELRKAGQYFEKALELEQYHRPTLQALVDIHTEMGKWEEVVSYTRWLLQTEEDVTVRFALLSKIGDLITSKLSQPERAVEAYLEALDLEPRSVVILRKLLDLYTRNRQWHEAVEILKRIIEQETDDGRKAKYYYTAAVILRDEIGDALEAVTLFESALDADLKMLKAFEAIDRILTQAKSWKDLSRAYRRMLHRVSENDDGTMESIKTLLWENLGEIYRSRLGDLKTATEAYKIAIGLNPENQKLRLILAELYDKTGDNPTGAIEQHRELIKLDPFRVDSYRLLFKSYIQTKEYDRAWCMAGALSFLQHASEQEEKFFRQYLGQSLQVARGAFNQEMFRLLSHPREDALISYIMTILGQGLRATFAQDIKQWGVHRKKDLVNLEETSLFSKVYTYAARTMSLMPAPQVYLRVDQQLGVRNANSDPAAVIIGGDIRARTNDREVAFYVAKTLCWMLPQHYIGSLGYPTEVLRLYFMALMDLTNPALGLGATLGEQGEVAKRQLMEMPAQQLMGAQKLMGQFLARGENPNLSEWLLASEHTAIRMGLLLCGDIHLAASCIKNDINPIGKATPKDKIRELVLFSISDEYFELRERLGLAIGK